MGAMTVEDRSGVVVLTSDATKVTPIVSTSNQVAHNKLATAEANEQLEVTRISTEINGDSPLTGLMHVARSFEDDGFTEGAAADFGSKNGDAGATGCTNNTGYASPSTNGTLLHRGRLGKGVRVRTYLRVTNVTQWTSVCSRNFEVRGRRTAQVSPAFHGPMGGAF